VEDEARKEKGVWMCSQAETEWGKTRMRKEEIRRRMQMQSA
jgi:hypothetical protein